MLAKAVYKKCPQEHCMNVICKLLGGHAVVEKLQDKYSAAICMSQIAAILVLSISAIRAWRGPDQALLIMSCQDGEVHLGLLAL